MEEKRNTQRAKRWEPCKMREISKTEQQMLLGQKLIEREGKWYGFNQKGEFVCLGIEICKNEKVRVDTSKVRDIISVYRALMTFDNVVKALTRLKVGDDIQTLSDTITQIKREKKEHYQATHPSDTLDRFITKVERPIFEQAAGNTQKGTFDFIRIDVCVVTQWHTDRVDYIQKHKKEITQRVLSKIEESKQFQQMGVPINFWKLSELTLRRDSILEYLFELKI